MFGVFSRILSQFWDGLHLVENENAESKANDELSSRRSQECFDDIQRGNFVSSIKLDELRKRFSGKVTKLYDGSGIIEEEVFFNFDKVIGGLRPKLGTEVYVEASREGMEHGWRADRVEVLMTDWSSFGEEGTFEVLVGEVTEVTGDNLIVNYDLFCNVSCATIGYTPSKGDWVRVELTRDRGVVYEVKSVGPLREKNVIGSITAVGNGHGYINTDIFFTFGACRKNYIPRRGHTVQVMAIESSQGNCKWRALRIEPKMPSKGTGDLQLIRAAPSPQSKFRQELLRDKQGVSITNQVNFGDVNAGEMKEKIVCIRNDGEDVVILKSVERLSENNIFNIKLTGDVKVFHSDNSENGSTLPIKQTFDVQIVPQSMLHLRVNINSRFLGEMNQLVVFNFGTFQIGRYFKVNIQDAQQELLNSRTPFHKRKFVDRKNALTKVIDAKDDHQWIIPGERPMFKQPTINVSCKLKQYEIPRTLRQYLLDGMDLVCLISSLGEPLSMRNFKERFSALLHTEEVQMELEMREFDLEQVSLRAVGELLALSVPGLAEGRPSLLIGDRVILSVYGASCNSPKYEGFIHEVLNNEILLRFHDDFHTTYDMDTYDVTFFFNRTPLRRAHKAVEMADYLGEQVLFPSCVVPALPQTLRELRPDKGSTSKEEKHKCPSHTNLFTLFNWSLNERQHAAVARILSGQCRPMPYILFGPPGTGKTVTLVEAILQVFYRVKSSRILACAPSNSATDLIAERLHQSGTIAEGDMVRLNAFQRQQNIPEDIENYSTSTQKLDMAAHYRIVICTCTTAGQLHTLGLPAGHFTHVFIDEAGQATEPESLVPISFLAGTDGQIILGGDPHQLGAVLRSTMAQSYGLNTSLLERLMNRTPYVRDEKKFSDHGCYDPLTVTKLVCNYRSHQALLKLPSRLFYHSELVACADDEVKNCLTDWDTLPNKNGFPLIFHGVKGEDLREGNSPSWFNAVEAVQVIRYVQELRSFTKHPVQLTDIGIVTPYRKQVEKIRLLLDRLGMAEVKVGSVEEFQGQERLVIVISTVRSQSNLIGFDLTHNLGFLKNPKRFNVAITRAQALLIIVGNPHVLSKDANWRALLQYCLDNNGYIGCDVPLLNENIDDISAEDTDVNEENNLVNVLDHRNTPNVNQMQSIIDYFPNNVDLGSDICSGVGGRKDLHGLTRDDERDHAPDCSREVKYSRGHKVEEQEASTRKMLGKLKVDNFSTEGKDMTNSVTQKMGGKEVELLENKTRPETEINVRKKTGNYKLNGGLRLQKEEINDQIIAEKITSSSFFVNQTDVEKGTLLYGKEQADDNCINRTGTHVLAQALSTDGEGRNQFNESADEDLEEFVYSVDP